MRKLLVILLFIRVFCVSAQFTGVVGNAASEQQAAEETPVTYAGTYFVSPDGNDSNTGLSDAQAWATSAKVQAKIDDGTIQPYDTISYKTDGVYGGGLSIDVNYLTFMTYGTGATPVLTASQNITTWTNQSGNLWYSINAAPVYQLLKGGKSLQNAKSIRYTITSVVNSTTIICADLIGHYDLVGASIFHYANDYFIDAALITAFNPSTGQITVDAAPPYAFTANQTLEIVNDPHEADLPGEYAYRSDTLYYNWATAPDSIVACLNNTSGFVLNTGTVGTKILGLAINGFNNAAIVGTNVSNTVVRNCVLNNNYKSAVAFYGTSGNNNLVEWNTIDGCMMWAIYSQSDSLLAYNNTIENVGLEGVHTYLYAYSSVGIRADGDYSEIKNNAIINMGYNAINFGSQNSIISNNYLYLFSQFLTDGGGIYTYSQTWEAPTASNSIVEWNIIIGNLTESWSARAGVYLDNKTQLVTVRHNTIAYCKPGILMNNPRNVTIAYNNLYENRTGISMSELTAYVADGEVYGNQVFGNKVYMADNNFKSNALITNSGYGNTDLYTGNNNVYWNYGKTHPIDFYNAATSPNEKTLAQWQTLTSQEANSIQNSTDTVPFTIATQGSNLISGDMSSGTTGWSAANGTIVNSGGYLTYTPTGASDFRINTSANHPTLVDGTKYLLQWDVRSTSGTEFEGGWRWINLNPDYENIENKRVVHYSSEWKTYYQVFESTFSGAPSFRFFSESSTLAFDLDNVSITEVTEGPKPELSHFVYNETAAAKYVSLPADYYWQLLDSAYFSNPTLFMDSVLVQPYSSMTFIKGDPIYTADFYVSPSGSDSNTGTSAAQSWRTLAKVNAKLLDGTISDLDKIALEADGSYTGYINTNKGFTLTRYGTGANPLVDNRVNVTTWTAHPTLPNVYFATVGTEPYWLLFDGKPVKKGDLTDDMTWFFEARNLIDSYNLVEYIDSTISIPNYSGIQIVGIANDWTHNTFKVDSMKNGNTFMADVSQWLYKMEAVSGDKYKLQNHPTFLEANGEWSWSNDSLFVYSSDAISGHTVTVSSTLNQFYLNNTASTVTIDGVDFKGVNQTLINAYDDGRVYLKNSNIQFVNEIVTGNMSGAMLDVDNINALDIFGRSFYPTISGQLDSMKVRNSTFRRCGLIEGYDPLNIRGYNGLVIGGYPQYYAEAYHNTIDSTGYNGISLSPLNNAGSEEVSYNKTFETNILLKDGGGIHIGSQSTAVKLIHHNWVKNSGRNLYHDFGGKQQYWSYNYSEVDGENYAAQEDLYAAYMNDPQQSDFSNNLLIGANQNIRVTQFDDSLTLGEPTDLRIFNNISIVAEDWRFGYYYNTGQLNRPSNSWADLGYQGTSMQDSNRYIVYSAAQLLWRIYSSFNTDRLSFSALQALGWETNGAEIVCAAPEVKDNPTMETRILSFPGMDKKDAYGVWHSDEYYILPFEFVVFTDSIAN